MLMNEQLTRKQISAFECTEEMQSSAEASKFATIFADLDLDVDKICSLLNEGKYNSEGALIVIGDMRSKIGNVIRKAENSNDTFVIGLINGFNATVNNVRGAIEQAHKNILDDSLKPIELESADTLG